MWVLNSGTGGLVAEWSSTHAREWNTARTARREWRMAFRNADRAVSTFIFVAAAVQCNFVALGVRLDVASILPPRHASILAASDCRICAIVACSATRSSLSRAFSAYRIGPQLGPCMQSNCSRLYGQSIRTYCSTTGFAPSFLRPCLVTAQAMGIIRHLIFITPA